MPPFIDRALAAVVLDPADSGDQYAPAWITNAIEAASVGCWEYDPTTHLVRVNSAWLRMLGLQDGCLPQTAEQWQQLVHPDDLTRSLHALQRCLSGETPVYSAEYRLRHSNGHWVWVLSRGRVTQRNAQGIPLRMSGVNHDITVRKQLEMQLADRERQLHALYEFSPVAMARSNRRGELLDMNQAFCELVGYSRKELMSRLWYEYTHPDDITTELELGKRALAGELDRYGYDKRYLHRSGQVVWVHMEVRRIQDWVRDEDVFLHVIHDISARKQAELENWQLANTDSLTQIPNRRRFLEAARDLLLQSPGQAAGLLMLDLDHFKLVNDRYGHAMGDQTLQAFSTAVAGALPATSLFGRLGGEEFAVLVRGYDRSRLEALAEHLLETVRGIRLSHDGLPITLTTSIGSAHQASAGSDALESLMREADSALYRAKAEGRDRSVMAQSGPSA